MDTVTRWHVLDSFDCSIIQSPQVNRSVHMAGKNRIRCFSNSKTKKYGQRGRVLAPVIGRYGGASSDLSPILDLVAREMARRHTAFYNIGYSEAKASFRQELASRWGHAIARGWATLLLDRLRTSLYSPPLRAETLLLSCTLRARRSVPL